MEGADERTKIVAATIKGMIQAGHSQEDVAKTLQFFANELRGIK